MATFSLRGQEYPWRRYASRPALADTRPERPEPMPAHPHRLPRVQRHPAAERAHQR